jgi:Diphosphoinositol pentakisphosphate kinase 2 N-terminal domain
MRKSQSMTAMSRFTLFQYDKKTLELRAPQSELRSKENEPEICDEPFVRSKENEPEICNEPFETSQNDSMSTIRVGICCREKKMNSRPMQKILSCLEQTNEFQICRMNDDMILNKPIEEWLRCDILIAFYSTGFPLQKALDYVKKYNPKQINDLEMQSVLWDRPAVLERLKKRGIAVAKSYVVLRGEDRKRAEMEPIQL